MLNTSNICLVSNKMELECLWKLLVLVLLVDGSAGAAAHSHSHARSNSPLNREREADGAYSPRGNGHPHQSPDTPNHNSEFDHEAIVGSSKGAEEYHDLSPQEAKARLRILVEQMDLDKNGQIQRQELKAWILRSFRMLSEEESAERFDEVDANEDGRVSWTEYVQETFGLDLSMEREVENLEEQQMLSDDKALFAGADKNGDGYLDAHEYLPFTHPEEDPTMLPIILKQTLAEKDKDGDGTINFKEYIGDRAQDKDTAWLKEEKAKFDGELDKNGDGLLDRQEILSWVVPSNEEIADEEVVHLFGAADDDHDDSLSYDEILEHHDVFVGSEVTDYGDHLHNIHRFRAKDEL